MTDDSRRDLAGAVNQPFNQGAENMSRRWSQSECQTASNIWDRIIADHYGDDVATFPPGIVKRTFQRIAASLGRDFAIVEYRHRHYGASFGKNRRAETLKVLAERDARSQSRLNASLTCQLFGDPAPGFSMLDRKLGELRR